MTKLIKKCLFVEKTPIPDVEASASDGEARLSDVEPRLSPILSPEEHKQIDKEGDKILDRLYSDSEEEREYQVC